MECGCMFLSADHCTCSCCDREQKNSRGTTKLRRAVVWTARTNQRNYTTIIVVLGTIISVRNEKITVIKVGDDIQYAG